MKEPKEIWIESTIGEPNIKYSSLKKEDKEKLLNNMKKQLEQF